VEEGADIIDFGAESSRPHARALAADEEIARIGDAVQRLREASGVVISVDTYHPETAAVVMEQGADILNDITALRGGWGRSDRHNTEMAAVAAATGAHVVLMHMPSGPETGLVDDGYHDVVAQVRDFLMERVELAERTGIAPDRIWLDPGYGFSKDFESNRLLLLGLPSLLDLGYGVLCGFSRKRMVGDALGLPSEERLEGSLALAVMAAMFGAQIIRVHDVRETARALRMVDAVRHGI
ncbi:MAG: dihydropteroate synthase, partial [Planctomycetaceae bacterium]|nr:dihydropteroate synthase [Planctomycetaceae bacterium]